MAALSPDENIARSSVFGRVDESVLVDVVILLAVLLREADVLDDCNFDIRLRLIESVLWPFILSQFEVLLKGMVLLIPFGRDSAALILFWIH